ncbi:SseB family protein [Lysobacter capsici]|uniref:SseB family protein n=1 Tax=Lysobacter capsici TaxID=435897 RepID=UPI00287B9094|nr:SseB family protein [Lysobacter capsici]WND81129.1 SseB family protein [Lysobacter capsici]WND86325.1 SseB family protein [Lysobacter capsici]
MVAKRRRVRVGSSPQQTPLVDEVEALLEQVLNDKGLEPVLLRALLTTRVYAHVPRDAQGGRLAFIQFPSPGTGSLVLPFFSDERQARAAAGNRARVIAMSGRQLLELTRGATLILNPNRISCLLYPEEVASLLDEGEVAIVDKVDAAGEGPLEFREPDPAPAWLIAPLIALYLQLPSVEIAYLVEFRRPNSPTPGRVGLLIAVGVGATETEHMARATITLIQSQCRALDIAVDLTAFVPDAAPLWIQSSKLTPFYQKSSLSLLLGGPETLQ